MLRQALKQAVKTNEGKHADHGSRLAAPSPSQPVEPRRRKQRDVTRAAPKAAERRRFRLGLPQRRLRARRTSVRVCRRSRSSQAPYRKPTIGVASRPDKRVVVARPTWGRDSKSRSLMGLAIASSYIRVSYLCFGASTRRRYFQFSSAHRIMRWRLIPNRRDAWVLFPLVCSIARRINSFSTDRRYSVKSIAVGSRRFCCWASIPCFKICGRSATLI